MTKPAAVVVAGLVLGLGSLFVRIPSVWRCITGWIRQIRLVITAVVGMYGGTNYASFSNAA